MTALKAAIARRRHTAGASLSGDSRVGEAATLWLALRRTECAAGDLAPRSFEAYETAWRLHVEPGVGKLRLREVTTARCEAWLVALRGRKGPATCRTARAVFGGVLDYAARMDAIPQNPIRSTSKIPGSRARKPRAMTKAERTQWLAWLDTHAARDPRSPSPREGRHAPEESIIAGRALGDISRFMLGTGCRIGEAMAISWDEVDIEARTVAIRHHLVHVSGQGLLRMAGAKSDAGDRVLRIPRWLADMLMMRRADPRSGYPVFPDELGGWRSPNVVARWLRWSREEAGFTWLTSHVFRQTVITFLDDAGMNVRENADHVGHSEITQTQSYMARKVASDRAAEILEGML